MIGRGKPLTAKQADSAIKGCRGVLATGPLINPDSRTSKREIVPESRELKLARLTWYIENGFSLIFAHEHGRTLNDEELSLVNMAKERGIDIIILEWDSNEVHRTEGYDV